MTDPMDDLLARLDKRADPPPAAQQPSPNEWLTGVLTAHAARTSSQYARLLGTDNTNH